MAQIKVTSSTVQLVTRKFSVVEDELELPDGRAATVNIVKHPGAVVILPRDSNGDLLLIRQYRHALRAELLEFPAGTLEPGEAPLKCAQREIAEETGFRAEQWSELGELYPAPGICDERQLLFFASELIYDPLPADDDESISVERYTPEQVETFIVSGALNDAKSISVFLRAKLLGFLK